MGFVFLGVIVLLGVFLVAMYNSLVQLRVRSESAWSDIDVQLKRRHGKSAERRAQESFCRGGKLSATTGFAGIHPTAKFAQRD